MANGRASARDLNRDLSRFSSPKPIVDRLGGEKFKDQYDGTASCQLLNHFVYSNSSTLTDAQSNYFAGIADFLDQVPEINTFDAEIAQWNTGFEIIAEDLRSIPYDSFARSNATKDIGELAKHLHLLTWYTAPAN